MKELIEKRNALIEEMENLLTTAETEKRAFSDDEQKQFTDKKHEIAQLDITIKAKDEVRGFEQMVPAGKPGAETETEKRAMEEKAFIDYFIAGEKRNLKAGDNGVVIPMHIANRIIETVTEMCPILQRATVFNVGGNLSFPVWGAGTLAAGYVGEGTPPDLTGGGFTNVELKAFIISTQTTVSKALINRTDIDVLAFIIKKVAESIAKFFEKELIVGTTNKMQGIMSATVGVTTISATAITADELIDLQMSIPRIYEDKAVWIMNKSTFKAIRKLKTGTGEYLVERDFKNNSQYLLLGAPVDITDSAEEIAAGEVVIAYGDMSGLYVKFAKQMDIELLREKYADQYAYGVYAFAEADSAIVEPQKIRTLKMKA